MKIIKTEKYAAMDKVADVYEQVVFLQGDEAEEAMKELEKDPKEAISYLANNFHYPGEHEVSDESSAGGDDQEYSDSEGYVLNWNLNIPYIGLQYIISD